MRGARAGGLAVALALVAVLASAAGAKNQPGTTYVDKAGGYAITVPTTWKLVPRTVAELKAGIAALKKKKTQENTALASTYQSILDTPAGRSGLSAYRFQAFDWPTNPDTPILTEVSLGIVKLSRVYTKKDLPAVGAEYANALSANKGSKIVVPKVVTLPAGPAEFIEGAIPAGTGLTNGVVLYLIPHGKRLFELSFQIDATLLSQATLFTSMAQQFRFV
jgi:hypothetical protein